MWVPQKLGNNPSHSRTVAIWLAVVAVMVFGMVILGGATRLTGSGLSITEWKPVTGAIPPLSAEHWAEEFAKYRQTTQYQALNQGMSLAAFQAIYWWEWSHRLLGRLIGLAYAIPFFYLLWARRIPRRLVGRAWVLLGLGALQGAVGWWMVASGLAGRVEVAPERLTIHLALALLVFCLLIWTALEAWEGEGVPAEAGPWRAAAATLLGLVFVQVMLGGLVAGNNAGQVFNDWPLMNGTLFPADYLEGRGLGLALMHSQAAVQFNHRIGAYLLFAGALAAAWLARRSTLLSARSRKLAHALAGLVLVQLLLGVATLMAQAPLSLSLLHQLLAAVILACAVAFAWAVRRQGGPVLNP